MGVGLSFRQSMSGSYWLLDAPSDERAIAFTLDAETSDVRALMLDPTWRVAGVIDAERLASQKRLVGTLAFKLFKERRIAYCFTFDGDEGRSYQLIGQEEWSGISPIDSLTLLQASICDDRREEIARATLRFDLRSDWARWLKSFRLRWG